MTNLNIEVLSTEKVYKLIHDNLYACQTNNIEIKNAKYRHETSYKNIINILNNGILSYIDNCKINGIEIDPKLKSILEDEGHINGISNISLSSLDLSDTILRDKDMFYEALPTSEVELIITNDIKTRRNCGNYANEYLTESPLLPDKFRALETRLLSNLEKNKDPNAAITNYNTLIEIAKIIKDNELDIVLRDVSYEELTLDVDAVSRLGKM